MIHHELGHTYVPGADGPEAVDMLSPREVLLGAEGGPLGNEVMGIRVEAMGAAMAWILEAGPHPREVAERLLAFSVAYSPGVVRGMDERERAAVTMQDGGARQLRLMRMLCGDPKMSAARARRHAEAITAALAKAYRRERHTWSGGGRASAVESLRGLDAGCAVRRATHERWCRHIWQGRPSLIGALKHFYVLARAYAPASVLNLTGEELAAFFGQVRASTSDRERRLINRRLERAGYRQPTLRSQKSAAACASYARAARGNHNRADSSAKLRKAA